MKAKLALLVGAGIGYVLGTRDGRERYEQLKAKATDVWHDPKTQEKVAAAGASVQEKAATAGASVKQSVGDLVGGGAPDHGVATGGGTTTSGVPR